MELRSGIRAQPWSHTTTTITTTTTTTTAQSAQSRLLGSKTMKETQRGDSLAAFTEDLLTWAAFKVFSALVCKNLCYFNMLRWLHQINSDIYTNTLNTLVLIIHWHQPSNRTTQKWPNKGWDKMKSSMSFKNSLVCVVSAKRKTYPNCWSRIVKCQTEYKKMTGWQENARVRTLE